MVKKFYSKPFLKEIIFLIFIGLLAFLTYRKLPLTFFEQDEWYFMGRYYVARSEGSLSAWASFCSAGSFSGHFIPLVQFFNLIQYTLFGLNFEFYAYASIFFHIINCFTFYVLAKVLFREKTRALLACLLFALSSMHSQAIIWIGAYGAAQSALLFALVSMIFFTRYLKNLNFKTLLASFIFLLLGLGFKETILFLFPLYPIWAYFSKGRRTGKKVLAISLIFLFIFFVPRLLLLLVPQSLAGEEGSGLNALFLLKLVYRLLTTPLKALAQVFIPAEWIISASGKLAVIAYPYLHSKKGTTFYDIVTQTVVSDLISYTIALVIIGITFFAYFYLRKNRRAKEARLLLSSIVFILLSSLPYIFVPGDPGYFSFLDSRYLYLTSLGASIFLVLIIYILTDFIPAKLPKRAGVVFLIFIFCLFYYSRIQGILAKSVEIGPERRQILEKISKAYPKLDKKSVFYTESTTSFYGQAPEEKMLPFQSGPGQMLLVWYSFHGEKFPVCFFENYFLWDLLAEGYKECGGRGFGYFRNYEKLVKAAREYRLESENIYAFSYNAGNKTFEDITLSVREKIAGEI